MKNDNLTLGSLFDGSGGFPLGGLLAGITPVWASEIEPFAVRVTRASPAEETVWTAPVPAFSMKPSALLKK